MPKGGARVASSEMPVGKGMGLSQHYETLCRINELGTTDITELMVALNKKFAWWDDPENDAPKETCRSYIKELWRLGLVDRLDRDGHAIILGQNTWRRGGRKRFCVSERGRFVLGQKKKQFPYFIAWCILRAVYDGNYPQCLNLFKLYDRDGSIPINDDQTVLKTLQYGIYVEKHAGKAIKFGWLEPCGLIYRSSDRHFRINKRFKESLKNTENINDVLADVEDQITGDILDVVPQKAFLGSSDFNRGREYHFSFEFTNKTGQDLSVSIRGELSSVFEHTATIGMDQDGPVVIGPCQKKQLHITLMSKSHGKSDSFSTIFCGFLEVSFGDRRQQLFFPSIDIGKDDRIWELNLCKKFEELGLMAFHLSGKSDRPDAVIDLSGLNSPPDDLLSYLRDADKEKLLMETTLGTYSGQKRMDDTQARDSDGTTKFYRHTNRVLQIKAIGQIIVADRFGNDINIREDSRDHIISLIDSDTLDFLIEKYQESGRRHDMVKAVLKSNENITKVKINSAFAG